MPLRYLSKTNLKQWRGKVCLLRVDLNVDLKRDKNLFRLTAVLSTIKFLLKNRIKIVILSHRGRPKQADSKLSLRPFAGLLSKYLKREVGFIDTFDFERIAKDIRSSSQEVFLFENLRFLKGEEANDKQFAKKLSLIGDFYVNDAFAVSHRKNASVVAITKFLPSYAGLQMDREIKNLSLKNIKKPFTVILGGAKMGDKIGVIKNVYRKADYFLLGSILGYNPKISRQYRKKVVLPVDLLFDGKNPRDIGPKTIKLYSEIIKKSQTVVWNGPVGLFEKRRFAKGTGGITKAIRQLAERNKKAHSIIGGGETVSFFKSLNTKYLIPNTIFLSTGGGAMIAYLAGKKLPGISALTK